MSQALDSLSAPSGELTPLDPELAAELPAFEQFFKTFGFKRVHGRVWGLLVLSDRALSAKQICGQLEISQGATSTILGELVEWGAVTRTFDSGSRCHVHAPVGNALSIVATILQRREQVAFQQFRVTADRALIFVRKRYGERDPRVRTLRSIISACEIAEALMTLLVGAVATALGDSQSILSRAIHAALKVGLSGSKGREATTDELVAVAKPALEALHAEEVSQTDADRDGEYSDRDGGEVPRA